VLNICPYTKKDNPKFFECLIECVLIRYDAKSKSYHCYNRATKKVHSSYHVWFLESHEGHAPNATHHQQETDACHDLVFMPLPNNDDEDFIVPTTTAPPANTDPPTIEIPLEPLPPPPCCSSHVPVPTEQNPTVGPLTTQTAAAVQESHESVAHVKDACQERRAAKQGVGNVESTSILDHDIINDLQQAFQDLDLRDQAHQLQALILKMTDFDPELLQFEDEPKTWNKAKNVADAA
jgi:hypothetical protein